jgi:hypothetical protein
MWKYIALGHIAIQQIKTRQKAGASSNNHQRGGENTGSKVEPKICATSKKEKLPLEDLVHPSRQTPFSWALS